MADALEALTAALADRYRIERLIGQGGMASVYLAQDLKHDRRVAIKVVRSEIAAALGIERFLREIRITAKLSHPNILPLHDSGEAGGHLFYVMPYVEGESLRQRLKRGPLPPEEAFVIARDVIDALQYAHAQGIVHRDIKPENILLQGGHPLIADFGLAVSPDPAEQERLTTTGIILGTLAYMSPEQIQGAPVDARADQYAFACVLHEMLAGERPTVWSKPHAIGEAAASGSRRRSPSDAALTRQIDSAVRRALSSSPEDRYPTMLEFGRAISGAAPVMRSADNRRRIAKRPLMYVAGALLVVGGGAAWFAAPFLSEPTPDENRYTRSVAVLYFDNQLPEGPTRTMAEALTDEMIARLSRIRRLRVVSPLDVARYRQGPRRSAVEVARELNVDAVLDGSVREDRGALFVTASLLDGEHGYVMWSGTFGADTARIFATQDQITSAIVSGMSLELSGSEQRAIHRAPTRTMAAYQLYLRAQAHLTRWNAAGLDSAVQLMQAAIAADSGFADAHAQLAFAYLTQIYFGYANDAERLRRIERHSASALAIDPTNETALLAAAAPNMLRMRGGERLNIWQARQLILAFERLVERNPDSPTGNLGLAHFYLWHRKDSTKAKLLLRRTITAVDAALLGDPDNRFVRGIGAQASGMLALILAAERNLRGAIELSELSLKYSPGVSRTLSQLASFYSQSGDYERAIATTEQALRQRPTAADSGRDYVTLGAQLYLAKRLGEAEQAFANAYHRLDAAQDDLSDYSLLYWLALARQDSGNGEPLRRLKERLLRTDARSEWTTNLLRFYAGTLDSKTLLEHARHEWQRCEAFYVIGARSLAGGRAEEARRYFQSAVATGMTSYLEYGFANTELELLAERGAR